MIFEIVAVQLLFMGLGAVLFAIFRNKIRVWIAEGIEEQLISWFSQPDNQKAVAENIQNMVLIPLKNAFIGQVGGLTKGVKAQLKGLENDMIGATIDQMVGLPVGDIALKYLDEYPILRSLIPKMLEGHGQKAEGGLP